MAAPFRLGCMGWIVVFASLLVVLLAVLLLWMKSDGDLRRIEATATAQGVPTTWAGIGLPTTPSARLAAVRRLNALATAVKAYNGWNALGWTPFDPPPEGLREWSANGGSGVDRDIDRELDSLDPGLFLTCDPLDQDEAFARREWRTVAASYWMRLDMIRESLAGRIACADADGLPPLLRRMHRLARLQHVRLEFDSLTAANLWLGGVIKARSLGISDPAWADEAEQLAHESLGTLPKQAAIHFVCTYQIFNAPAERALKEMNMRLPAIMCNPLGLRFFYRTGRGPLLERELAAVGWLWRHGSPTTLSEAEAMAPAVPRVSWYSSPGQLLGSMLGGNDRSYLYWYAMVGIRARTGLRLLAADLRGTPWPVDPTDPAGGLIRPVVRDGVVIGAYACGHDGVDGGGDRMRDWCWTLHERLGSPKASDPPPPAP